MTKEELNCIDKLSKAHNSFIELPIIHDSDRTDWVFHIHALQNILMSRDAVRNHPDIFNSNLEFISK